MKECYWLLAIGYWLPSIANEGNKKPGARCKKLVSCHAFILFLLLVTLLLSGCTSASSGESEVMQELRKSDHIFENSELIQTSYFFYPSTMRMVNIDRMPNWDEAIKEVRRLSIFSMWPDRFDQAKQNEVVAELEAKENFALYAEMEDKYSDFKLLGRNNGTEAILIYNDSTVNYVVHLLGKLNYVKLMKLSGDLRDTENRGAGIDLLVKAMGQDEDRAIRQRHYYDRRKEIEAAEQLRKDSIEAALNKEPIITE